MNELQGLLEEIDRLLSAIPVSGDSVMLMAEARRKLKTAYCAAKAFPLPAAEAVSEEMAENKGGTEAGESQNR